MSSVGFSDEHLLRCEQRSIVELNGYTNTVLCSAASIWTPLMLVDNTKCYHLRHEMTFIHHG